MGDSGQGRPRVGIAQAEDGMNSAAAGVAAGNAAAGAAAAAHSAGAPSEPPPEGGGLRQDDEVARLQHQLLEMIIRMEVQAEERDRTNTAQRERLQLERLERLQPVGGMVGGPQQRAQPGTFMTLRARNAQSGPFGTIFSGAGGDGDYASGAGQDELKVLVDGYKGFGMLSLIRVLIFRDFRSFLLAVIGILLLVGQWAGPVGFIAFKLESEDISACDGDGGIWAKFIMISVAMIYFARLSLTALSHKEEMPVAFEAYKMPKWWGLFRHADLIVTWLVYDTFIFLANLLIVFQDRRVEQMVVDVLALEFFTIIDDEFKSALIAFDSSFLRDIATATQSPEAGHDDCCDVAGHVVGSPLKGVLLIARAICRVGGPLCAFVMIFYGPICLGSPDGQAG